MTTRTYTPTKNPGDERTRVRHLNIMCPLGAPYVVELFEQTAIRRASGEASVDDQAGHIQHALTPEVLAQEFPLRDPITDADTGQTIAVAQALAAVYSVCRGWQMQRDTAENEASEANEVIDE